MFIIKLLFILNISHAFPQASNEGTSFSYFIDGDYLVCEVHSLYSGWVAVAFNSKNQLKGSNLIMGAAENGFFKMSDRYIVEHGVHKSVLELGSKEAITDRNVTEDSNGTTMTFKLQKSSYDKYHIEFIEGNSYTVHLAASVSDDFNHHSTKRFSITITL